MNSELSTTIARWVYGLPFAGFGAMHLLLGSELNGYVPSFLPGGVFWVYLTGVGFLAASLSFLVERHVRLAASLLGAMFLAFVLTFDLPRLVTVEGRDALLGATTNLLIDLAFAGSALLLAERYARKRVSTGGDEDDA